MENGRSLLARIRKLAIRFEREMEKVENPDPGFGMEGDRMAYKRSNPFIEFLETVRIVPLHDRGRLFAVVECLNACMNSTVIS